MTIEKINEIILNYKDKPNKDLLSIMEILETEFEKTKSLIIDLTNHLDKTQENYNLINEEYIKRKR